MSVIFSFEFCILEMFQCFTGCYLKQVLFLTKILFEIDSNFYLGCLSGYMFIGRASI